MNTILDPIKITQSEFPNMQFSDFCNLWQIADEIKTLNTMSMASAYLEQQRQYNILKIIQNSKVKIQKVLV